ncbi:hypothetical protein SSPO_097880 [Streptomyces antimycoticus]|uniref:Uncharacterized protein n=1 Tax=Streptomyces antimycoticus TaxID=68175 RepID=A0A499V2M0_9ACTN|nr:hypothetical protein SSPO_097880 [Streptomyces antimycoticus]
MVPPLPMGAKPSTVTVSQDAAGRWFVSMLCEDPGVEHLAATSAAVGIDVGLDHLLTLSTGEKIASPRHERRDLPGLPWPSGALRRRPRGPRTGRRPGARSPGSTPGSPTVGVTGCTS